MVLLRGLILIVVALAVATMIVEGCRAALLLHAPPQRWTHIWWAGSVAGIASIAAILVTVL